VIGEQRATDVLAQLRQIEQLNDIRGLVESMAL
jgi:hypothetical protein